ncbi:MAG: zinc ribbon domain-containing protein [Ktedonobacteraceae bacterium]|nr:zinc ribbon domain-containing protein [Ktedonobacteraceae bacterium]
MRCPNCHIECEEADIRCPGCGTDLTVTSTSLVPARSALPVLQNTSLSRKVATGVGALVLGLGIELVRRGLLSRLIPSPARVAEHSLPVLTKLRDILPAHEEKSLKKARKGYEIQETVVYVSRRVIRR